MQVDRFHLKFVAGCWWRGTVTVVPKISVSFLIACVLLCTPLGVANPKLAFWDEQRKGANGGAEDGTDGWFRAAADFGIEYIRLAPNTIKSDSRDFLLGDADKFFGIAEGDLQKLMAVLDRADKHGVKIVLTTFSLPGRRWRQQNDMKFDFRLWNDHGYQDQAMAFWQELAFELKDHPAIVGYNIVNEPHPEREAGFQADITEGFDEWLKKNEGGVADLNRFYVQMLAAIRSVDKETPVFVDSRFHSNPEGFKTLKPINDPAVLYSFHFYEPWIFTTFRINNGRFAYPDRMPTGNGDETEAWSIADLSARMQLVRDWAEKHGIPKNRIHFAEFGCGRKVEGSTQYLSDVIKLANKAGWHWAFYSFRAGGWDSMNYELGTEKLGWKAWQEIEAGTKGYSDFIVEGENPLWEIFESEFRDIKLR